MPSVKLVYALYDLTTYHNGIRVQLRAGEAWDASDDFVKARKDLFDDEPPQIYRSSPVEQATRAPGEKRTSKRG